MFDRENPGFDAFVGNPPFAGKNTISAAHGDGYLDWLKTIHEESHGNADLVAHFFRRAFDLLRTRGAFGLIATNTIGQGDTRATGLRWICTHGGTIYAATRRKKWPDRRRWSSAWSMSHKGLASPGPYRARRPTGARSSPPTSSTPAGTTTRRSSRPTQARAFRVAYVLGMGFTFDDTDTKGVASPIAEMHELIAKDPRNAERIFPYIGGEEVNDSPTHAHHRYVINFGEMSEEEAERLAGS